jgi:RNA polymerase sigma-70 factor (ECF subfamily)
VGQKDLDERRRKEELLARLYDEHYDKIARYISIRIGHQAEAEDLAGEVFLKALESLDSYQERGAPMQAWLFKIAHNLLVDYVRKVSKQKTIPIDTLEISDGVTMEEIVERQLQSEKLSQVMKQLTPAQREVIGLRFFAGLTSTEVGEILGKSSSAVREMQSAAVKSLRKLMYEGS